MNSLRKRVCLGKLFSMVQSTWFYNTTLHLNHPLKIWEFCSKIDGKKYAFPYEYYSAETHACNASSNLTDPVQFEFCLQASIFHFLCDTPQRSTSRQSWATGGWRSGSASSSSPSSTWSSSSAGSSATCSSASWSRAASASTLPWTTTSSPSPSLISSSSSLVKTSFKHYLSWVKLFYILQQSGCKCLNTQCLFYSLNWAEIYPTGSSSENSCSSKPTWTPPDFHSPLYRILQRLFSLGSLFSELYCLIYYRSSQWVVVVLASVPLAVWQHIL